MSTKTTATPDELRKALTALEAEKQRLRDENKLAHYQPYDKQRDFHAAGAQARDRLLMAGNQLGKTLAGVFEAAVQRILLGRPGEEGTGAIPKDAIAKTVPSRGVADLLDTIRVRHVSGAVSTIGLKSYEKGREKFQGETLNYVWLDEECPSDVYMEALTRTNTTSGPVWLTFTPLAGMSEVVRRFLLEPSPDRHVTTMTIDDALHFTHEQREQIIRSYPTHEREARTRGVPTLGSGRIFPVSEEQIACERIDIPTHWPIIGGMDFGWDHPFAAVELAHDRDTDTPGSPRERDDGKLRGKHVRIAEVPDRAPLGLRPVMCRIRRDRLAQVIFDFPHHAARQRARVVGNRHGRR